MELKKWQFGTPMGEQIEEQNTNITDIDANITEIDTKITEIDTKITDINANLDEIDKFITGSGWKPITLGTGWEEFTAQDKPMYFDYGLFYIIKGRIKPVKDGVINPAIGNLGIAIPKASDYVVATLNPSAPTGSIFILNSGDIRVRNISSTSSMVSLDGIVIPK